MTRGDRKSCSAKLRPLTTPPPPPPPPFSGHCFSFFPLPLFSSVFLHPSLHLSSKLHTSFIHLFLPPPLPPRCRGRRARRRAALINLITGPMPRQPDGEAVAPLCRFVWLCQYMNRGPLKRSRRRRGRREGGMEGCREKKNQDDPGSRSVCLYIYFFFKIKEDC